MLRWLSSAADRMKYRNLGPIGNARVQAADVADVLLPDEDVDVLPDLSLLGCHPMTEPGAERPQRLQCVSECGWRRGELDPVTSIRKGAQRRREIEGHGHF
jgi:hypothetical protein